MVTVLLASLVVGGSSIQGKLGGSPVTLRHATVKIMGFASVSDHGKVKDRARQYSLELAETDEFMCDRSLSIWFQINPGESIANRTFEFKPFEFGTPGWRAQQYGGRTGSIVPRGITTVFASDRTRGNSYSVSEIEKFSSTIKFSKPQNGWVAGTVKVALPGKPVTALSGEFRAKITNQEVMP